MNKMFTHKPVLLDETIELLNISKEKTYLDLTLGLGGHSRKIVEQLTTGRLIVFDQDLNAINMAKRNLSDFKDKITYVHSNFSKVKEVLQSLNVNQIDGALMDIGVSSYQIDDETRGFSYMRDGILDMRMDLNITKTAKDIVNEYDKESLIRIFSQYGQEHRAKTVADRILKARKKQVIDTTFKLRDIVQSVYPNKEIHPEKRVFQALRIEVNDELRVLEDTIEDVIDFLTPKSRLAIITFHSLEDRIVKEKFKLLSTDCICPNEIPVCICDHQAKIKVVTKKPIIASDCEQKENSRSKSAKLRVCQRM